MFGSVGSDTLLAKFSQFSVNAIYLLMGLSLLEIFNINFPSITGLRARWQSLNIPEQLEAFLLGATSALVSSPCSSPILASLLIYVAGLGNPLLGALFLLFYSFGYVFITVLAGVLSRSTVRSALLNGSDSPLVGNVFGFALICYGTFSSLKVLIE